MFVIISRTFKEGFRNLLRNGWLSVASVSVLFFSLLIISLLFSVSLTANGVIKDVQEKINVSVYFRSDVEENKIMDAKKELEGFQEVVEVQYISKEKALEDFRKENANEETVLKALDEIGENPLLSYLIVRTQNSSQYENVANFVKQSGFKGDVSRVNYDKNKEKINQFNQLVSQIRRIGIVLGSIFALVAILITFNTIRLTIYSQKQEIEIMRLVGASNVFIRLPFIFEGMIYGFLASILSMAFLFGVMQVGGTYAAGDGFAGKMVEFYLDYFWRLLGIQLVLGIFLGVVSSFIAMRKYLKV